MPADPLTELLSVLRPDRREVAVSLLRPVEFCLLQRREMGLPQLGLPPAR